MELSNSQKLSTFYKCITCDYITSRKSDYVKHMSTDKHLRQQKATKDSQKLSTKIPDELSSYDCECGKNYKNRSSLWKHKKKQNCHTIEDHNKKETNILTNAIIELIKQNNDLRHIVLEQNQHTSNSLTDISKHITTELINAVKTGGIGTTNNNNNTLTNNNSHNTTFNLHFFLNETCKDALNINEFIQNIKVSNEDLEETARLGYSGGISRIFINELNQLDITKKPIHCSDAKRETVYIKENDIWEKDDEEKTRLTNAIKQTARKNIQQIFEWEKLHPICKTDPDSRYGRLYNKIILNSMSGGTIEEQVLNINKVIKNIVKHVVIDKQLMIT